MNEDTEETFKDDALRYESNTNKEEEGDEMDDVFFPVTIVSKTIQKNGAEAENTREPSQCNVLDEMAIVRCFDLSVLAHLLHKPVPAFKPWTCDSSSVKTNTSEK
jgi:hypothetical protein